MKINFWSCTAYSKIFSYGYYFQDIILDSEPLNRLLPTHDIDIAASLLSLASLTHSECSQYICSQIVSVLNTIPGAVVIYNRIFP